MNKSSRLTYLANNFWLLLPILALIMSHEDFTIQHRAIGRSAAWAVFCLGVVYSITLVLGLCSLKSPQDPIGDPFFSMMEMLILLMAPLIVLSLAGLIGVPLANMQVRTIGVLGYAGVAPIVFLLLGVVFGRAQVPIQSD
jgi:hypothetical protein